MQSVFHIQGPVIKTVFGNRLQKPLPLQNCLLKDKRRAGDRWNLLQGNIKKIKAPVVLRGKEAENQDTEKQQLNIPD